MPVTLSLQGDPAVPGAEVVDRTGHGVRAPDRMYYPHHSLITRESFPPPSYGDIHPADPIRDSDWYAVGKPFPFPGMAIDTRFSIAEWEDPMPLGFVSKPAYDLSIAQPVGKMQPTGGRVNIETPPAVAFGSLVATVEGDPLLGPAAILGLGA